MRLITISLVLVLVSSVSFAHRPRGYVVVQPAPVAVPYPVVVEPAPVIVAPPPPVYVPAPRPFLGPGVHIRAPFVGVDVGGGGGVHVRAPFTHVDVGRPWWRR